MENLKELIYKHGFSFKKAFGQNFITDNNLLDSIAFEAGVTENDTVLEIGVGAAALTKAVCKRAKKVVGYEIDGRLKPLIEDVLSDYHNAEIIYKDFMKCPIAEVEKDLPEGYIVVANLPYYITTPVIMRFIEQAKKVKRLVIMVQEEVAYRLVSAENTPDYGAITVAISANGSAKIIKKVGRNMFTPVPNVDSAVVMIDIERNKYDIEDYPLFRDTVRAAFTGRRKTLANNLIQNFKLKRSEAEEILAECGIDLKARGETLSAEKFSLLAKKIGEKK